MKKEYSLCGIKQGCCQIWNLLRGPELPEDFMRNMQIEGKWHQQLYCQIYSKWICNIVHGHHKWIFIGMSKSKSCDSLWHYSQICTNQELLNTAIRCCWEEASLNTITMLITFWFLIQTQTQIQRWLWRYQICSDRICIWAHCPQWSVVKLKLSSTN